MGFFTNARVATRLQSDAFGVLFFTVDSPMPIEPLKALVPPPAHPSEVGTLQQWQAVERQLGLVLPTDYREFIFSYGTGLFADFYRIYNPFAVSAYTAFIPSVLRTCAGAREIKGKFSDRVPFPLFPDRPGLLPWGNDENGNDYFWLTEGDPDTWKVLSDEVRGDGFQEYGCTMTEFLTGILLGKFDALAGDYPQEEDRVFKTWTT
jgi:hypothetical protein